MKKRILFISIGAVLAIMFLLPLIFFGVFHIGNAMGEALAFIFLCYGIFFHKANRTVLNLWRKTVGKIFLSAVALAIICGLLFTVAATGKMISAADNPPQSETTVIVLGCMVYPSGPSLSLLQRLQAAEKFLKENPDLKCILSGGQGDDEPMSEARAMYDYLTSHGIASERLYLEEKSTSTQENIRFSKEIIEKEGLCPKVTIITNNFHQYRAQKIAKNYSMECYGISAKSHPILLPCYYLRELGGILAQKICS